MDAPNAAAETAPPLVATFGANCRIPPPPELLDADTRQMIEAQDRILMGVMRDVLGVAQIPMPGPVHRARVCPPGWWGSSAIFGSCSPFGRVVMMAAGAEGMALDHVAGPGSDFRIRGLSPEVWAVIAGHEACHAAHWASLGPGAAAALATDPDRRPGEEPAGFGAFVRELHHRWTGRALPGGYDPLRWPQDAPGLGVWTALVACAVSAVAIPPPLGRQPSEEEWMRAWRREASINCWEDDQMRAAAAAWRAEQGRAVA
ncbi:hypothetical protein [Neoroseomonas soli]|uniref:Uncharacterized protein n=1 Tax=Neoroseomonas soli TaxID=1081025 RepID=A0A9X9WVI7_9PROT|nr:hypothetical protein [Neoroseomonas soli]MBR0671166.1 hypothetical protein [Neoroseomonas soli]